MLTACLRRTSTRAHACSTHALAHTTRAPFVLRRYVGPDKPGGNYTVFMSGQPDQRKRAQEYLGWLFDQLRGPVYVDGWEDRDDVTMVDVPQDCVGYVTGARRATLGKIEEE